MVRKARNVPTSCKNMTSRLVRYFYKGLPTYIVYIFYQLFRGRYPMRKFRNFIHMYYLVQFCWKSFHCAKGNGNKSWKLWSVLSIYWTQLFSNCSWTPLIQTRLRRIPRYLKFTTIFLGFAFHEFTTDYFSSNFRFPLRARNSRVQL